MRLYVFSRGTHSWKFALTSDKTGSSLPKYRAAWPWLLVKTIEINEVDPPRIGASSQTILESIEKDGYFLWPSRDAYKEELSADQS